MAYMLSPLMGLPVPVVGSEPGPQYATDVNNCMGIVDGHNHTIGSGNQLTPESLAITGPFPFNDQPLTNVSSVTFTPVLASPNSFCVHVEGVDLYYTDGNGVDIPITLGGNVNATSSGLFSGTASATFVSSALVVLASSLTPANISGASLVMGLRTTSVNRLTLAPPASLAGAGFTLTLPSANGSGATQVMTLSSSNSMGSITYDAVGVAMTSVGANAIANTMNTTGTGYIAGTITQAQANTIIDKSLSVNLPGTPTADSRNIVMMNPTFNASNVVMVMGQVNINASHLGQGFSAAYNGSSSYTVTFTTAFTSTPFITVTAFYGSATSSNLALCTLTSVSTTAFTVVSADAYGTSAFQFIAIGPLT